MLPLLVSTRFQVLFHSPPGVLFTFPSRYYFSIGHQVIFRLGRWSSRLPTGFLVSRRTLVLIALILLSLTRLLRSLAALSNAIQLVSSDRFHEPATPDVRRLPVWPLSRSLAATWKIAFAFFSSAYLDVSVQRVPSSQAIFFTCGYRPFTDGEFPHSDICGSTFACNYPQLFAA